MTTTVASVLTKVGNILQDTANIRWSQAELLDWLNDGQRELVNLKPNAFTQHTALSLVSGTKQSLPADGVTLVDVVRNMGADSLTAGNAVRATSRRLLDSQVPGWHSSSASATVKHYVYDLLDPKIFYVYPPASAATYVEVVYIACPANATLVGNITVDDIYEPALVNYIIFRAASKDSESAPMKDVAAAHYQLFQSQLGIKAGAEAATSQGAVK